MKASKIIVSNRTKEKAEHLKDLFKDLEIVDWGDMPNFDMIINATSIGLSDEDEIKILSITNTFCSHRATHEWLFFL